jgi:hypothetical protein
MQAPASTHCHPEQSEGPVQFAGRMNDADNSIGPSARKHRWPQDDEDDNVQAFAAGWSEEPALSAIRVTNFIRQSPASNSSTYPSITMVTRHRLSPARC